MWSFIFFFSENVELSFSATDSLYSIPHPHWPERDLLEMRVATSLETNRTCGISALQRHCPVSVLALPTPAAASPSAGSVAETHQDTVIN